MADLTPEEAKAARKAAAAEARAEARRLRTIARSNATKAANRLKDALPEDRQAAMEADYAAKVALVKAEKDVNRLEALEDRYNRIRGPEAKVAVALPEPDDQTNKNPWIPNDTHWQEINRAIEHVARTHGIDRVVVTHFRDGSAVGVAHKAKRIYADGLTSLPRVPTTPQDGYIWVGLREPISGGTVT